MNKLIKITFNIIGSIICLFGTLFIVLGGFGDSAGYLLLGVIMLFSGLYIIEEN